MKWIKYWFFEFNRNERFGILWLLICIVLILLVRIGYSFQSFETIEVDQCFIEKLESMKTSNEKSFKNNQNNYNSNIDMNSTPKLNASQFNIIRKKPKLFHFDPNKVDSSQMINLGFSIYVINNILKWRKKGGRFYKNKDMKKIYGMNDAMYTEVESYITIPKQKYPIKTNNYKKWNQKTNSDSNSVKMNWKSDYIVKKETKNEAYKALKIELNSATIDELVELRGIGEILGNRIIKFRDGLGGFSNVNQVSEVFGLSDSTFQVIVSHLLIEDKLKLLYINNISQDKLASHPYINYKQAKTIIRYREHHGNFNSIDDLYRVKLLSKDDLKKLKPYISFDD